MVALAVVFSSYASEVFLSAFRGIPAGQYEGARSLGLGRMTTLRLVILPQLVRLALPGLSNLWLILLKDTALVSVIGLNDILRNTSVAVGVAKEPFLFYFVACMIYLVLSIISSVGIGRISAWAERGGEQRA
jgi:polar amino acid transport system permease protein